MNEEVYGRAFVVCGSSTLYLWSRWCVLSTLCTLYLTDIWHFVWSGLHACRVWDGSSGLFACCVRGGRSAVSEVCGFWRWY